MPRSTLNDYCKSRTGAKARRRDPMMETIKGRIKDAKIPQAEIEKALGLSNAATRARLSKPGGEWKIVDLCRMAKAIGIPVAELLDCVTEKDYWESA